MENFKLHEDAIELTEKYSAYQLAKMLLKTQEKLEEVSEDLYILEELRK